MELKESISFCYKGNRKYVHGTDIFNKVVDILSTYTENMKLEDFDMAIRQVTIKNMDLYKVEGIVSEERSPNVLFSFRLDLEDICFALIENDDLVNCNYDYDENSIVERAVLNLDEQTIELADFKQFTLIEKIVALNKALLNGLYPNAPGKWYFVRVKLADLDFDIWRSNNFRVKLKMKKNLQFKITDSIIFIDGKEFGHIYFSLVKNSN